MLCARRIDRTLVCANAHATRGAPGNGTTRREVCAMVALRAYRRAVRRLRWCARRAAAHATRRAQLCVHTGKPIDDVWARTCARTANSPRDGACINLPTSGAAHVRRGAPQLSTSIYGARPRAQPHILTVSKAPPAPPSAQPPAPGVSTKRMTKCVRAARDNTHKSASDK